LVNEEKHNEKSLLGETVCVGDSVITMRVDRVGWVGCMEGVGM